MLYHGNVPFPECVGLLVEMMHINCAIIKLQFSLASPYRLEYLKERRQQNFSPDFVSVKK